MNQLFKIISQISVFSTNRAIITKIRQINIKYFLQNIIKNLMNQKHVHFKLLRLQINKLRQELPKRHLKLSQKKTQKNHILNKNLRQNLTSTFRTK